MSCHLGHNRPNENGSKKKSKGIDFYLKRVKCDDSVTVSVGFFVLCRADSEIIFT